MPGYEALLNCDQSQLEARLLASAIVRTAREIQDDQRLVREGASIISSIARRKSTRAQRKRLTALIGEHQWCDLLDSLNEEGLMNGSAFEIKKHERALLQALFDEIDVPALTKLAASLKKHLPETRGRLPSRAHISHALITRIVAGDGPAKAYTYDDVAGDYVDPITLATRAAFDDKDFDPLSVRRSTRRRAMQSPVPR